MKKNISKIIFTTASFALIASIAMASIALADNGTSTRASGPGKHVRGTFEPGIMDKNANKQRPEAKPAVVGTVKSVNGNTITITSRQEAPRPRRVASTTPTTPPTSITYTVDATNAVVKKSNATTSVSSITAGDMIVVQGTVTGTNFVATIIHDNTAPGMRNDEGQRGGPRNGNSSSTAPAFVGNGQPVVAGKVATISGNTLTVTTTGNTTYTVDATNARVLKGPGTATLSNVATGDFVIVQGTVNGSSMTATSIIDRSGMMPGTPPAHKDNPSNSGFVGGIKNFFGSLFGF